MLALVAHLGAWSARATPPPSSQSAAHDEGLPAFTCIAGSWAEYYASNHKWVRARQPGNRGRVCRTRGGSSNNWICPDGYAASQRPPYCVVPGSKEAGASSSTPTNTHGSPQTYQEELLLEFNFPSIGRGGGCYAEDALGPPVGGNPDPMPGEGPWVRPYRTDLSTPLQCSATRTVPGHPVPLELMRRKLANCERDIEVAVLGGSVSCGKCQSHRRDGCCAADAPPAETPEGAQTFRNGGCVEEAWPARLQTVLQDWRRRLCRDSNRTSSAAMSDDASKIPQGRRRESGRLGSVVVANHCKAACGSNYFVHRIAGDPTFLYSADVVIAETSTNDLADIKGLDRQVSLLFPALFPGAHAPCFERISSLSL